MQKPIVLMTVLVIATAGVSAARAQTPNASNRRDLVEVAGCLTEEPKGKWLVTNATEPVVSKNPYTNEAAIKAAEAQPLGRLRFELIAISMFNPDAHRGHKVAIKGLLIKDPNGDRVNVTSLQMVSMTCQ